MTVGRVGGAIILGLALPHAAHAVAIDDQSLSTAFVGQDLAADDMLLALSTGGGRIVDLPLFASETHGERAPVSGVGFMNPTTDAGADGSIAGNASIGSDAGAPFIAQVPLPRSLLLLIPALAGLFYISRNRFRG